MRRKRNWSAGGFAIALLCVLLLAPPGHTDPILDPLRDMLVRQATAFVSRSLNGTIEVGALRGSLLGSPVLYDVRLLAPQGEVIARVREIRLVYDLTSLLKQRLEISQVEIIEPQLTLEQEADGRLNIVKAVAPQAAKPPVSDASGAGLPFGLVISGVRLRNGRIILHLPALAGVQQVTDLEARLQGKVNDQGMRVQVQQLTAHTSPANVTMQALQGTIESQHGVTRLKGLRLELGDTQLTGHGVLPGAGQQANLTLHMQPLDLTAIGQLVQNPALRGQVQVALRATGPPDALQVSGQLSAKQGQATFRSQLDTVASPLRYEGHLDLTHLNMGAFLQREAWHSDLNLSLRVDGTGVTLPELHGTLRLDVQASRLAGLHLQPSAIYLAAQGSRLQVQRFDLKTSAARMNAAGVLDLAGNSDLQYDLSATLDPLQTLLDMPTLAGSVQSQGTASGSWPDLSVQGTLQATRLHYQDNRIQSLHLSYHGAQLGRQPQATASLQVDQAQAGTIPVERVALDAAYQGSEHQVRFTTQVVQSAEHGGTVGGILKLQDTGQQVMLDTIQIRLPEQNWYAPEPLRLTIAPQRLHLQQLHLVHGEASLRLSGAIRNNRLQDIRLHASQIDLSVVQPLLQTPAPIGGRGSLQVQLEGLLTRPQVQADLVLQATTPQQLPFQRLHTTLTYDNKRLSSTVQVQQGQDQALTLEASLPVDLAFTAMPLEQRVIQAPVEVRLTLDQPSLAALQRWWPNLPPLAGTLQGSARLEGTYARLAFNAGIDLQQLQVAGVVERLGAPLEATAVLVLAASVPQLVRDLQQGTVTPEVRDFTLRMPTLQGRLPGQAPPEPFAVRDFHLNASAKVTQNGPQITLEGLQAQVTGFDLPRMAVELAAQWTPQRFKLSRIQVDMATSSLHGQGSLTFADQQLQFQADIPRLRLTDLPIPVPPELPPTVQGRLTLQGHLREPRLQADLRVAGGRMQSVLVVHLQDRIPSYKATLRLRGLDIKQLLPQTRGALQVTATLHGSGFDASQRRAELDLRLQVDGFPLAPGLTTQVQARLAGDTLQVRQFRLQSQPITMTAEGTLSARQETALHYTLTLGELTPLQQILGVELRAGGRLTGQVNGTLGDFQTQGTLQVTDWQYATLRGKRLLASYTVRGLPSAPQATLSARLIELQAPALPLSSLQLEAAYADRHGTVEVAVSRGPYEQTRVAGEVDLQDELRLTLDRLRLQHQDLVWENPAPIRIVRSPQGTLRVQDLRLRSGEQALHASGTLSSAGAVRGEVQLQQIQIGPNLQVVAADIAMPDGHLNLDLSLRGTLRQPRMNGQLHLTNLRWREQALGEIRAEVGLQEQTVRTDLRWQTPGGEYLKAQGTVGLATPGPLNLTLQAPQVDLAWIAPLSPAVSASGGRLRLDLRVTGTLAQPQADGRLSLDDGRLQLVQTGERYRDIEVRLRFADNRMDIERLIVGSRSGPLEITGQLAYAGPQLQQIDLTLKAEEFTALHTPAIEAMVTAAIQVQGSLQEMIAVGTVTVPRARYVLEDIPGSGPKSVRPWELTVEGVYGAGPQVVTAGNGNLSTGPRENAPLPFLRTDLNLTLSRNVWVQGPGTAVELSGAIKVTKDLEEPFIVSGSLETMRGFVSLYSKKFNLQEGRVTFTGSPEINPLLDVTVTHDVADYLVTIVLEGRLQAPKLQLSSTPELPQADIVSLLLIGKTTDRLTGSERNALGNQASQMAGNLLAGQLEKRLGQTLGLDMIDVEAGDTIGSGSVSVGRYITQDLFVSYEQGFGEDVDGTAVSVEYNINRNLKLKAESGDLGEIKLDFLWELDY